MDIWEQDIEDIGDIDIGDRTGTISLVSPSLQLQLRTAFQLTFEVD